MVHSNTWKMAYYLPLKLLCKQSVRQRMSEAAARDGLERKGKKPMGVLFAGC